MKNSNGVDFAPKFVIIEPMQITWYGQACFKISSGDTTLVLSPFEKGLGLNPPRGKADVVLLSGNDTGGEEAEYPDATVVIRGEGEYEVKGVLINGFSFFHTHPGSGAVRVSTVYTLTAEDVTVCHLDNAMHEHVDAILEKIGAVDVLLVPVGGAHTAGKEKIHMLDAEQAVALIGELEPRIVIPMYYKVPGLSLELAGVNAFLKAMGGVHAEPQEKATIKRKDLPQDETKVITLSVG